jgi:DNA repair exonuclease SbcCD ATPase subunit
MGVCDELQESISNKVISGPDVAKVWKILDLPEERADPEDDETAHEQINTLTKELDVAEKEAAATANMAAPTARAAAAYVADLRQKLQALEGKTSDTATTFMQLDKHRAGLVLNHDAWLKRKSAKEERIAVALTDTQTCIEDAMAALREQQVALNNRHEAFKAAWKRIDDKKSRA